MVMSPYIFAFISVALASLDEIIFKYAVDSKAKPYPILAFYCLVATALMAPFVGLSAFRGINGYTIGCIALSAVLWFIGDLYGTKAYEYLDASVCEVVGSSKLVLIGIAGILIFNDSLDRNAILGMCLIVLGVFYQSLGRKFTINRGIAYMGVYVVFVASALILDKYLSGFASEDSIVFICFLFSTVLYFAVGRVTISEIRSSIKLTKNYIVFAPILGIMSYYSLIKAFQGGGFASVSAVQQVQITFILALEIILLKAVNDLPRKAFSSIVCLIGAIAACGVL
ncbi:MAG: hypothetical protein D6808_01230 [Candidatus Dadabacteria bacterium]|nr:MAG: hypothetical protein D6808_01230 [Candidatus Dadabacteria bacterium]